MFGSKKKPTVYDVSHKKGKTWWGGTKQVPTSKAEQRKLKPSFLRVTPAAL